MKRTGRYAVVVFALLILSTTAFGQQGASGVLTGNVTTEGTPLPGVTVTISSSALQGTRTTVSNSNGAYNFPALPPGVYTIVFELEGMDAVTSVKSVGLVQTARADAIMGMAAMTEAITVTASAPTALETTAVSSNFTAETIDNLPVNRTLTGALDLAPGVSTEGVGGQRSISGAPSYNNLYLINGGVVNETIRGQSLSVYIEDAIEETTVLSGNISSEYGRFTGGVVSALTKSGGNEFSGSFRTSITNDSWTNKTPYPGEADKLDENNYVYEATLGGRIVRDRLWFFAAGRSNETSGSRETRATDIPYDTLNTEDRYEGKLTAQITPKHSIVASYLEREVGQDGNSFGSIVDLESLVNRTLPYDSKLASYNGILTSNFLLEAQYSETGFAFVDSGSIYTDLVKGTILRDNDNGYRGNSPTFCGVCDDETRDNNYLVAKGTYFLSTASMGNHNLVAGFEDFTEMRFSNNHQSGSGYRLWGDMLFVDGSPTYYFHFPTEGDIYNYQWNPILKGSETNQTNTASLFVNDKWDLDAKWSFNIGFRYDKNDGEDQAGVKQSNDSGFSHRLGAVYDIFGDGRHRVNVGFNRYTSSVDNGVIDEASTAGSPAAFYYQYLGPEINPLGCENSGTCIPNHEVIQMAFDWFFANVNPDTDAVFSSVPGVNRQINGELQSPYMDEYSIGYGTQIGSKGYFRADYINRSWSNFYVNTTNMSTGQVTDSLGRSFDLRLINNSSDYHQRKYDGVQMSGSYRFTDRLNLGANYTYSTLKGTAEGEASNSATDSITAADSFPEFRSPEWNTPNHYLGSDIRHRFNGWISYDLPMGRFGNLNFSWLERYRTGSPYYQNATISTASYVENPGYLQPDYTWTYWFDVENENRTDDEHRSDLGINYGLPIGPVELFVQADVLNIFDESAASNVSGTRTTTYSAFSSSCRQGSNGPDPGARCLTFNPWTEVPVEGIHWQKRSDFGEPISTSTYQLPLTYRFSVGLRF